jgi:hypothetical protein
LHNDFVYDPRGMSAILGTPGASIHHTRRKNANQGFATVAARALDAFLSLGPFEIASNIAAIPKITVSRFRLSVPILLPLVLPVPVWDFGLRPFQIETGSCSPCGSGPDL